MNEVRVSVELVSDSIDPSAVLRAVADPAHGATALFLGTVRDHHEGRQVEALRYDAYEEMVVAQMQAVGIEAAARAGAGARVRIVHRIGPLAIGEIAVAVAVSSAHRAEAFEGSRFAIDELKLRVPIWKKERFVGGADEWVGGELPGVAQGSREQRTGGEV